MVRFCEEIVKEIESAGSEAELQSVIENSISRFKATRNHKSSYILNMIVTLRVRRAECHAGAVHNIKAALEIFKQIRKQNPGTIF